METVLTHTTPPHCRPLMKAPALAAHTPAPAMLTYLTLAYQAAVLDLASRLSFQKVLPGWLSRNSDGRMRCLRKKSMKAKKGKSNLAMTIKYKRNWLQVL